MWSRMTLVKAGDLLDLARMAAASHSGITLEQIRDRFGVSHRTAQRMRDRLLADFPDVEETRGQSDRKRRWRLARPPVGGQVDISADQLAAIDMAIAALGSDSREAHELRRLADDVRSLLPRAKLARVESDHEALLDAQGYVARPGPRPKIDAAVDAAVAYALKGFRKIAFDYASRADAAATERRVLPLGLLSGMRRYLVALPDGEAGARVRIFRLDKIDSVKVQQESFVRPPEFNLQAFAKRGFGAFVKDEEYGEVVWRFAPEAAERARAFSFHPDQTLEDGADGSLTVRFSACGHLEMCWHLYAWGDKVEVVAPAALRAMVADHRRSDFAGMP